MANIITISRIILAFIALAMLSLGHMYAPNALILTILVMWFDGLDGFVARKCGEESKFGAVLDVMGDRIVENLYWLVFASLGWIGIWVPIVVVTRGIVVDSLRSMALAKGFTPFGENSMLQDAVSKFFVASEVSRFTYALVKALAFILFILAQMLIDTPYRSSILVSAQVCTVLSVFFCVLRALPVVFESKVYIDQ